MAPMKKTRLPKRASAFNPLHLKRSAAPPVKPGIPARTVSKAIKKERIFKRLPWPTKQTFHFTWKKLGMVLGGFVATIVLVIAAVFAYYVKDIPNPKTLSTRVVQQSTKITDRNGKVLYSFYGDQNRTVLNPDQISDNIKNATVALEDASFYTHPGFDLKGIARAGFCDITHLCRGGGGSTITQQYLKNTVLNNDPTLSRKIKEVILATEVEQRYSKQEILTGYLNEISYGGSIYGIEAASQSYFGKSAKDLTLSEAATLASIPQRPAYFSPYGSHLDALFARKDYALNRMATLGLITQEQADAAKKDAPNTDNPTFAKRSNLIAPHFVFFVRQQLIDWIGGDPTAAERQLDESGYTVTTSLDLDTQNLAESIMSDMGPTTVKKYGASNASLSAVDPSTGEVLAMVGSVDYSNSKSGNTNFATALLQPGSSFKPFVYATEFDKDHKKSPASITYDVPTDFGNYAPQNYDGHFRGPVTNRNALAQSLNIPAVKNLYLAGIPESIATAQRLGISTLNGKPGDYGLSLVLGAGEVKPVEMANAYAAFENGGLHNALRPILNIAKDGKVVKDFTQDKPTQALEPEVAYQITSILSDNNARTPVFGSRSKLILPDRPVAAKSGTTNSNRDGWTVGFTPQISVAVWVGNNEANKTMIKGADGSVVAAPIWNRFMQEYHKGKPVVEFTQPATLKTVTVDRLSGKLPTDQSPPDQLITDLFADWQIPTTTDDVHTKVKIDKVSGKLATSLTPADSIIEQFFISIHSEVPDKPNWEDPVQQWARDNGGDRPPPTATDDIHVSANQPSITISSPKAGTNLSSGNFTIVTEPSSSRPITSVVFYVNNVSVGTVTAAPWSLTYSADSLPTGTSVIEAHATNDLGLTQTAQVTVNHGGDSTPPGPVLSLTLLKNGAQRVKLSWTNPADADLANVAIYQSTTAGSLGSKVANVTASPNTAGSTEVTGLALGITYFTVRTLDASGNENSPGAQVSVSFP